MKSQGNISDDAPLKGLCSKAMVRKLAVKRIFLAVKTLQWWRRELSSRAHQWKSASRRVYSRKARIVRLTQPRANRQQKCLLICHRRNVSIYQRFPFLAVFTRIARNKVNTCLAWRIIYALWSPRVWLLDGVARLNVNRNGVYWYKMLVLYSTISYYNLTGCGVVRCVYYGSRGDARPSI